MNASMTDTWTSYRELLSEHLKPQMRRVILLAVLLFVDIGLQLVSPQIIRRFIDTVKSDTPLDVLTYIALLFIAVSLVQQGISVWSAYVGENVSWTATNSLRSDLARHCLNLDMSFHNGRTPGEMIERIDGDVNALGNFFSQFAIQMLGNVLLMVGILVLLFFEDWRAGAGLTLFTILSLSIALRLRKIAVPHMKATREESAKMFGFLEERLSGAEDIRASRAQFFVLRQFYERTRAWLKKELKSALMINILVNVSGIVWAIGNATALGVGAYLYAHEVFSLGAVYMIFHYTNMLLRPIERITFQLEDLQRAGASIERVSEFTQMQSQLVLGRGDVLEEGRLSVRFDHVTFGYAEGDVVLHDVDFTLKPGRVLGLLGRTGSGKTTLTRLLFRLYDPWQGAVILGNTDVRHVDQADLCNRIAMVTQNVQLFQGSVRDNLTLFDATISGSDIHRAIEDLALEDWFATFSDGLNTELASEGGLSAGEAQLLAFARVFLLKDPDVIVLDEASSRLDPATEHHLEKAVDRLIQDRTAIVIAHRLDTVARADDIMILENGRIVEYGERVALEQQSTSRFAKLLRAGMEDMLA
jgi:ATP-binding cassette subfamily B protein